MIRCVKSYLLSFIDLDLRNLVPVTSVALCLNMVLVIIVRGRWMTVAREVCIVPEHQCYVISKLITIENTMPETH
jgi:hypothetical protein